MFKLSAYLNLQDKVVFNIKNVVDTDIKKIGNVNAVYVKGFANTALDPDFGCGIDIEIGDIESYMADFRRCEFWCMPEFGTDLGKVHDETQGLIYKKKNGIYGVILPVVSEKYKCVLQGKENGVLTAKLFSWYDKLNTCDALAFLYAEGENPYTLLKECTRVGLDLLNTGYRTREERRYPEIFEYLGWCSWDAMEIRVNEDDLLKKCQEFKDKNIPVKWAIIDDMWAEVHDFYNQEYENRTAMFNLMHSSKLYSFEADPKRFPNGLKGCIDKIKDYGITVGMWHPTTGYWAGIDTQGDIYRDHKDCLIQTDAGMYLTDYKRDKAYKFYNAFHDFLRQCGAEFIKIDNQSMTRRFYKNLAPVGEVARNFHDAIEASVGQHFDNAMINCMGMGSEDMWNRSVSPISRCSDDFQPENSEWFIHHILMCSYNDLIQGQFYYCDWDMWWTDDGQASKNSLLRAVSGGPIYISDKMDRSNPELLLPLCLNDGKILRCDKPAMPTLDCLTVDPRTSGQIFKLQNTCGESGVIAAFNINANSKSAKGYISPMDIDGLEGEEFAVYEHFSREFKILKPDEKFEITLNNIDDFKLYVVVPMKDGFAPIGRTDKFISPKTIKMVINHEVILYEPGEYAVVEDGKLLIKK